MSHHNGASTGAKNKAHRGHIKRHGTMGARLLELSYFNIGGVEAWQVSEHLVVERESGMSVALPMTIVPFLH